MKYSALELKSRVLDARPVPLENVTTFKDIEDEVTDFVYNKAIELYQLKTERIAKVAFPVIKNVYSNKNNNFQNIVVPFTDGVKSMQVATNLKDAYDSEGKTLTKDFEKGIVLAIIDDSWKEHLREMDELRQNVQGAQYEQKDPLLVYKLESFELFKAMLARLNNEAIELLMKLDLPIETEVQSTNKENYLQNKQPLGVCFFFLYFINCYFPYHTFQLTIFNYTIYINCCISNWYN